MQQHLRGYRPLAETVSPLVTYKWLTQQPEHHNSPGVPCPSQRPSRNLVPRRPPMVRSVPVALCPARSLCSAHPPQSSHMLFQAPWILLTAGCLEMAGPEVATSQTLTHEPPLGLCRVVPGRTMTWAPSIFCSTAWILVCWKALWDHTGDCLEAGSASGGTL